MLSICNVNDQNVADKRTPRSVLFTSYSGTRLIRTPTGYAIVYVLSRCPCSQKIRNGHKLY